MPKLTRAAFADSIDLLWQQAQKNFTKDQRLHGILVAVDAMGRQQYFMQAREDDPLVTKHGFVPIPGPWVDHLDKIGAAFRAHKAVAGIMIGEAWLATDEVALETMRMDIAVHEHPMREEIIFVVGFWPREFYEGGHQATIERDERGENPHLTTFKSMSSDRLTLMVSWLEEILPQPHGR